MFIRHSFDTAQRSDLSCSYKLKVEAAEKGSAKQRKLLNLGINYLCVHPP